MGLGGNRRERVLLGRPLEDRLWVDACEGLVARGRETWSTLAALVLALRDRVHQRLRGIVLQLAKISWVAPLFAFFFQDALASFRCEVVVLLSTDPQKLHVFLQFLLQVVEPAEKQACLGPTSRTATRLLKVDTAHTEAS